jgi:hypothetical protein
MSPYIKVTRFVFKGLIHLLILLYTVYLSDGLFPSDSSNQSPLCFPYLTYSCYTLHQSHFYELCSIILVLSVLWFID